MPDYQIGSRGFHFFQTPPLPPHLEPLNHRELNAVATTPVEHRLNELKQRWKAGSETPTAGRARTEGRARTVGRSRSRSYTREGRAETVMPKLVSLAPG